MPAGRACRCSSIPFSVHCGLLPTVRRAAPVSSFRGCPGNASSFGGEAGTSWAKLSWPLPRLLDGPGLVDSQRLVPVRGWGAGGVAGGPSQLYGHSHGNLPDDPLSLSIDVGVDSHEFCQWHFEEVQVIMKGKAIAGE